MDSAALTARAGARTEELPGSELTHPFGPEVDVYKVRGKVFALIMDVRGEEMVTVKAHPRDVLALTEAYPEITPGYHMSKKHWVSVRAGVGVSPELVDDLVAESYLLVVEKLPRAERPVDPAAFAVRR
ncbi:MmcQ/YjbR family DNA-binding protein [Brachybacterium sp. JHP9]|uniref:MmcQ/YjbR family DNA-binding protein n=1 Tax=Brachybacterium equifaecis TaxID=2910770 RepID=A0ABT0R4G8_9MICO|nr:MmcQ/YjbR family DNA-binding protein [Brachybacterium equifaecis]MCL6424313.1 MmcQ/YjbR family DNA-binding protein [Brachybacterium equifaecis]